MKHTFSVKGMHCNSCKVLVSEALEEAGAKNVTVGLNAQAQEGVVNCVSDLPKSKLKAIIEAQGAYFVQ
jgi:copper chaperone CopZ